MANLTTSITTEQYKGASELAEPNQRVSGFLDYWRAHKEPDITDLIKEYKRIIYACAMLNAEGVARIPLKLYVKTGKNDKNPRVATRRISLQEGKRLVTRKQFLGSILTIDEVVEHPVLTLLSNVNDHPGMFYTSFVTLTQLYLDITGKGYWLTDVDRLLDRPKALWVIPTQFLTPKTKSERKRSTDRIIDYYEFKNGTIKRNYSPDVIIPFFMPNLSNPYLDGLSPLQASYEATRVSNKLIAHEDNFLENEARPDGILSPGKGQMIDEDLKKAWGLEWYKKFAKSGTGRLFIADEEVNYTPVNYPPRDLARLEIHKWSKIEIANAYGVPMALLNTENVNRAILESAREQHALNAIVPRIKRIEDTLNEELLPRYDDSGRLFFAFDDPVPEVREQKLAENTQLVQAGIITRNEARKNYGYPPHPDGDDLLAANVSPGMQQDGGKNSNDKVRPENERQD